MKTSRIELLEIGAEIVRRQGLGGLSFGMLAERTGIRKASVHHHFSAKSDFTKALVEAHVEVLASNVVAGDDDQRRGYYAMRALLRERREALDSGNALDLVTAMSADAGSLPSDTRQMVADARELVVRRLAGILQTGRRDRTIAVAGNIEDEARAVLAQIEGAELAARAAGDIAAFDRSIATLEKRMAAH